ncbi:histidine ammonia-lyase [Actinoalloteichus sp. AHMU CJ021]|uniref:Histidine ammonia-lyase n=1 Tax=Actinoalloteichus caeruleus DSM 43889 TaxID=1120930 RepID=A0ABT1JD79_ACTCY|nr:histidine ammonia-lyase [Actinoalloteichus caeruleus]AUS80727.1 histidine ammonia-lyase [Actinoalloteichus sp. AHMU CJ021]MCP2330121.1 histidine ammonia-lyase [Actinoalloteichus caeruleus DSM 43889]
MEPVLVGGSVLTERDVVGVARSGRRVAFAPGTEERVRQGRRRLTDAEHAYGVATGLGALAGTPVPAADRARAQHHAIRSHAAGAGAEVERDVVRALMLLRLRTLASGRTGVRPAIAVALADLLNADLTPVVREYGSLGCSGDLAPLAHVALALVGEGTVRDEKGVELPAREALRGAGLRPVEPREKEGLSLINGTEGMLGQLCLSNTDLSLLLSTADLAAAMTVEALLGSPDPFDEAVQTLRPHPGQRESAENLRWLLAGSALTAPPTGPGQATATVQDAYSLRCWPQVAGSARDTLGHARLVADRELAAVVDNPVLVGDGRLLSNGNFHGAPIAHVLDFLAVVVADVASISERRTDRLLDPARNRELPAFLAHEPGIDSGHMIAQYTQAAVVAELKRLAVPASVDSLPTSGMQEDHVSMGWGAARKLRRAVEGLRLVLGVEILVAARALDLRGRSLLAPATSAVVAALRGHVAGPGPDRFLAPEIEAATALVAEGTLVGVAAEAVGRPLH